MTPTADPWLMRPRPYPSARLRLFCLPFAGGGASAYRTWPEGLPGDVELCAVQPPGREGRFREPAFARLRPLVAVLTDALRPCLDRPFAVFGHSLGAVVAFEWVRELRRRRWPTPAVLVVSGRAAPHLPSRQRPIHALPEAEFRAELARFNGTPAPVLGHDELMRTLLPLLRADFAAAETYEYVAEPALDVPITAAGGADDPRATAAELNAWHEHTRAGLQVRRFPGDHFYLQPQRSALLAFLTHLLAEPPRPGNSDNEQSDWPVVADPPALDAGAVHVWSFAIDRDAAAVDAFRPLLDADELRRAERFYFRRDADRFVTGRGLLRTILGAYLGREPGAVRFRYNDYGKPSLGDDDGLRFNLAHSHGLALLALTRGREVGVDLERVRPEVAGEEIAERYFSPAEVAAFRSLPPSERERAFFACWTRKEAYLKALGRGLTVPLDGFEVTLAPGERPRLRATPHDPAQVGRWELRELAPAPGSLGAVAVEGRGWNLWCARWPSDRTRNPEPGTR